MAEKIKDSRSRNVHYWRLLVIDGDIANDSYPNSKTLSIKYEVSIATIKRDIEYMKIMLNAPILYSKVKRGYYYENKIFRLPAIFTTEDELFSGAMALKLLSQYKNTPIYKHVEGIFNNFYKVLSYKDIKNNLWVENRVLFIEEATPNFSDEIWNILIASMTENRYIEFSYKGPWMDSVRDNYYIAPYQIICKGGTWYFAGYSNRKSSVSLYALHRVISVSLTDEHFEMDKNYKYFVSTDKVFGVYGFDRELKCSIQFFNETVTYISEREWADDQVIEHQEDGSIIMTFSSGQIYEVVRFILSQGSNALPLEPAELVDEWKNQVKTMYENILEK